MHFTSGNTFDWSMDSDLDSNSDVSLMIFVFIHRVVVFNYSLPVPTTVKQIEKTSLMQQTTSLNYINSVHYQIFARSFSIRDCISNKINYCKA